MLNKFKARAMAVFLLSWIALAALAGTAHADIQSCAVSLPMHTVAPNSISNYVFSITNTDTLPITYIKISRPSGNFIINGTGADGWSGSNSTDTAYESEGTLNPGETVSVTVIAQAPNFAIDPVSWIVEVSDVPGQNMFTCSGDTSTQTSGAPADLTPPTIYNISVSVLSSSMVDVTWLTDEPANSHVTYGFNDGFAWPVVAQDTYVNEHTVRLTGLQGSSGYHFQVSSADNSGNTSVSGDNTFLTLAGDPVPLKPTTALPPAIVIILNKNPTENELPKISLDPIPQQPQKAIPLMHGIATDNDNVAAVEYSIDGGRNWIPIPTAVGLGTKKVDFSFRPDNLKDGNFAITVRAIDHSSNQASTVPQNLVIDLLPPTVGSSVVGIGAETITPGTDGKIITLVGIDQRITLQAVGGPTSITLVVTNINGSIPLQRFSMAQSADSGLWSGVMSFSKTGTYRVTAQSIDGANNNTSKVVATVQVNSLGHITNDKHESMNGEITIYTRDQDTNKWIEWDAETYGQENPIRVQAKKGYGFLLPTGTYYLKITAPGRRTVVTRSFETMQPRLMSQTYSTHVNPGISLGPVRLHLLWPELTAAPENTDVTNSTAQVVSGEKSLPNFKLIQTDGGTLTTSDFFGKPSVLSFINTWSGSAGSQLESLKAVSTTSAHVAVVGSGESLAKLNAFSQVSNTHIPITADTENTLINTLGVSYTPVTYFIDRHGIVKKVMVGVLSKEDILNNLTL